MASPYTSQSASGYNSSPPADDGSAVASNQVLWATIKTNLGDPNKNLSDNINSAVSTAFGKISGGASTSTQSTSYQVLSSDQGKLIIATASGITVTTPDATSVSSPFQFRVLNNSSGTITVDGSGSQTIDGNLTITISAGAGVTLDTDGTNWYTNGIQGTLVGKQLGYGVIVNGTISESNATNAVTYAIKTLAGTDPSSADPVLLCFRNATQGTGNYVYRTITAAMSLTISSGSTLGASNGVPFKVWLVVFDDAGTLRIGAINTVSGKNVYALGRWPIASSTAEGGAGAADSAQTFYTGTAVTSKAYVPLGWCAYESGLATAGSWNVSPTTIQLYGPGVPLPGQMIQVVNASTTTAATTTTGPTVTNLTASIAPTSGTNLVKLAATGEMSVTVINSSCEAVIKRGGSTDVSSIAKMAIASGAATLTQFATTASMLGYDAPGSTSSQTYAVYITTTAGTMSFPETGKTAWITVEEIMT